MNIEIYKSPSNKKRTSSFKLINSPIKVFKYTKVHESPSKKKKPSKLISSPTNTWKKMGAHILWLKLSSSLAFPLQTRSLPHVLQVLTILNSMATFNGSIYKSQQPAMKRPIILQSFLPLTSQV
jgi:hypothetical protein